MPLVLIRGTVRAQTSVFFFVIHLFIIFPSALGVTLVEAAEVECSFCGALFVRELLLGHDQRCARCHIKLLQGCSCTQVSPKP